jgi:hypothetical protein
MMFRKSFSKVLLLAGAFIFAACPQVLLAAGTHISQLIPTIPQPGMGPALDPSVRTTTAAIESLKLMFWAFAKQAEESYAGQAAWFAELAKNNQAIGELTAKNERGTGIMLASQQLAMANAAPRQGAQVAMMSGSLIAANADSTGPLLWREVNGRIIDKIATDDSYSSATEGGNKRLLATFCAGGNLSPEESAKAQCPPSTCSGGSAKWAGTAFNVSRIPTVRNIDVDKPCDMNGQLAILVAAYARVPDFPSADRMRSIQGGTSSFMTAGLAKRDAGLAANALIKMTEGEACFSDHDLNTDYSPSRAIGAKYGRQVGTSSCMTRNGVLTANLVQNRELGMASSGELDMNGARQMELLTALNGNNVELRQRLAESRSPDAGPGINALSANASAVQAYLYSPEFQIALKDGSFALEVNKQRIMLAQLHGEVKIMVAEAVRREMLGEEQYNMFAFRDEDPHGRTLAQFFKDEGKVDLAQLTPVVENKRYAGLMPTINRWSQEAPDPSYILQADIKTVMTPATQLVSIGQEAAH